MLLTGCSVFRDPDVFIPNPKYKAVRVTWVLTDDLERACGITPKAGYVLLGCAKVIGDWCVIITPKETTMSTLGHELRHCFEGKWHD